MKDIEMASFHSINGVIYRVKWRHLWGEMTPFIVAAQKTLLFTPIHPMEIAHESRPLRGATWSYKLPDTNYQLPFRRPGLVPRVTSWSAWQRISSSSTRLARQLAEVQHALHALG